ncbi:LOW QUALITY PROTEIN: hypothetical protein PoB_003929300 [Plakobranchus ocellatus]|uniref:Uncharacterized protein n=1 Tax=Plakobranchus ocellatus TaxID=259542 RepID=A0AAV4AZQ9_9GAST|nr:LOW QUALITY PROTEIN: hypothetical protein PoB_003929300 [Plakobranchus ocellatus]
MCTQAVQLSTRDRPFGRTSECAQKGSNSQDGIGNLARHPNVHTRGSTLNTGLLSRQDFRMCTQDVQLSTRNRQFGRTSEFEYKMSNSPHGEVRQDFPMCTQDVQLSTRDRQFGRTSECEYKMSNSPHGVGNLTTLSNVHTSCPTLNTGLQFGKTSEYAHKRCNSPHGKGNLARLPNR